MQEIVKLKTMVHAMHNKFCILSLLVFSINITSAEFTCGVMNGVQSDYQDPSKFSKSNISGYTFIEIEGRNIKYSYADSEYGSRTYVDDEDIVNVNLTGRRHLSFALVQNTSLGNGKSNLKTESYVLNWSKNPIKLYTGIAKTNNLGGNVSAYVSDCSYRE